MTTPNSSNTPLRTWSAGHLSADVRRSLDRLARTADVAHVAVMPDVHLARDVCVGTAFATTTLIYPQAIGGDIGCGMAAVALDAARRDLDAADASSVRTCFERAVPIHRHRAADARAVRPALPPPHVLSRRALRDAAERDGPFQLGTLGTGNHFLELQFDEHDERLWLMVHSGSRGLGPLIRDAHLGDAPGPRNALHALDATTPSGAAYLEDHHWARAYAAANRHAMLDAATLAFADAFGWHADEASRFDCDHNHISAESPHGTPVFVHRKGVACPKFIYQPQ